MSSGTSCLPSVVEQRHEAQVNTYTPLFAPPTPPASPTPSTSRAAVKLDVDLNAQSRSGTRSLQTNHASASMDTGFVVVPAKEDPLSLLLASTTTSTSSTSQVGYNEVATQPKAFTISHHHAGNVGLGPPHYDIHEHYDENTSKRSPRLKLIPLHSSSSDTISNSPYSKPNAEATNSTLAFFDKFVHEAKTASDNKRRSLLDEILLHQDNPLFRWAREEGQVDAKNAEGADCDEEEPLSAHPSREGDGGSDCDSDSDPDGDSVGMEEGKNRPSVPVRYARGSSEDGEGREDSDPETRGRVQDALVTLLVDPKSFRNPDSRVDPGPSGSHQYSAPPSSFQAPGSSPPRSRRNHTRRPSTGASRTSSASVSSTSSARHSPTLSPPSLAPPLLIDNMGSLFNMEDDDDQERLEEEKERSRMRGSRFGHQRAQSQSPAPRTQRKVLEQDTSWLSTSPYSTLSGIPARWMSSLSSSLSKSNTTPGTSPAKGATPSLESIFAASSPTSMSASEARSKKGKFKRTTVRSASSNNLRENASGVSTPVPRTQSRVDGSTSADAVNAGNPDTADPQIARKGHGQTPIQIPSHRSRFSTSPASYVRAASITHETPFGSQVFVPISGAPGFMGERYDWDKGFSNGLMKEMRECLTEGDEGQRSSSVERDSNEDHKEERNVTGNANWGVRIKGRRESVVKRIRGKIEEKMGTTKKVVAVDVGEDIPVKVGLGEFMEKKSGSIALNGRNEVTTPVLEVSLADMLRPQLPALDRLPRTWHLVYSLDQHGISLNTLYARCEAHIEEQTRAQAKLGVTRGAGGLGVGRLGMFLAIKDSSDAIFGVWMGEGIRQSKGKGYYGSGESFMWRFVSGQLSMYRWTGKNKYVALCEPDYISFGGGDGQYGLYLDESLLDGSSACCPTFDNEALCSPGPEKAGAVAFECVGLEVWAVGP